MRTNRWILFFGLLLCCLLGNAQTEALIVKEYDALKAELSTTTDEEDKQELRYFLAVCLPFYQLAKAPPNEGYKKMELPQYLKNVDPSFFSTPKGKEDWLNESNGILRDLGNFGDTPINTIGGKLFNISIANDVKGQYYDLLDKPKYLLKLQPKFDPLRKAIKAFNYPELLKNTKIYEDKVAENLVLYERKYSHGYRNRNVLEYFVNGGLQGWKERKIEDRGELDQGFLKPPSRLEVIFLANPIIGIGSPSFKKFKDDPNSVYLMVQIIGIDIHRKDFKKFGGASIFHASPINTSLQFFTRPQLGIEVHYNKLNLGFGVEYPKFKRDQPDNYGFKVFLSFAAFDMVFEKKGK